MEAIFGANWLCSGGVLFSLPLPRLTHAVTSCRRPGVRASRGMGYERAQFFVTCCRSKKVGGNMSLSQSFLALVAAVLLGVSSATPGLAYGAENWQIGFSGTGTVAGTGNGFGF